MKTGKSNAFDDVWPTSVREVAMNTNRGRQVGNFRLDSPCSGVKLAPAKVIDSVRGPVRSDSVRLLYLSVED